MFHPSTQPREVELHGTLEYTYKTDSPVGPRSQMRPQCPYSQAPVLDASGRLRRIKRGEKEGEGRREERSKKARGGEGCVCQEVSTR
jgi:hypothetical protein